MPKTFLLFIFIFFKEEILCFRLYKDRKLIM